MNKDKNTQGKDIHGPKALVLSQQVVNPTVLFLFKVGITKAARGYKIALKRNTTTPQVHLYVAIW